jgi:RNA polymerase sigma-70 factor (ECF subfamily)
VQDSLLKAFVYLSEFCGGSEFSTWLTRIVINEALMNLRRKRRKNEVPVGARGAEDLQSEIADLGLSPEEDYSLREFQQLLIDMVERLKPSSRTVFQFRYLQQLSTNAVAALLRLPVSRARLELREALEKHFRTGAEERNLCQELVIRTGSVPIGWECGLWDGMMSWRFRIHRRR